MIEELIKKAAEELRSREKAIDKVMGKARRIRVVSKQAIFNIHDNLFERAEIKLNEAFRLIKEMEQLVRDYVYLERFEQVHAAQEEYAEASIFYKLKKVNEFPEPNDIGVSLERYVMGLGDVPGELRREALDALRMGNLELAEDSLNLMERIYLNLISMEEVPLLKGLRRKLDITRGLIERTRSEFTSEIGRSRLDKSIKQILNKTKNSDTKNP